jgi:hypothetical protein
LPKSTSRLTHLKHKYPPQLRTIKKTQLRTKAGNRRVLGEIISNLEVEPSAPVWGLPAELGLKDTAREARIREASKPLYLKRYE